MRDSNPRPPLCKGASGIRHRRQVKTAQIIGRVVVLFVERPYDLAVGWPVP